MGRGSCGSAESQHFPAFGARPPLIPRDVNIPLQSRSEEAQNGSTTDAGMGGGMDRRRFVLGMGGAFACPSKLLAQVTGRVRRIGFFGGSNPVALQRFREAFLLGLKEHGWVEGKNVEIMYRYGEGVEARLAGLADELIAANCDVIFTAGTTTVLALMKRTRTVPIVSSLLHDAVAEGMAHSIARPGGNITGTSSFNHEILTKRIELLREVVPSLKTLGVLYSPTLSHVRHGAEVISRITPRLGIRTFAAELTSDAEIGRAFSEMARERCEAMIVQAYPVTVARGALIAESAIKQRIAALGEMAPFADAGGLLSHGPDWADLFRRSASHVDRILRGARPGDLPIEHPTRFELVANANTAAALGIRFPLAILVRADRVIE